MAIGQPRLLTWRSIDKALRLYEYSPINGFVQIATSNSSIGLVNVTETSEYPYFSFVDDSQSIFITTNVDLGEAASLDRYKSYRRRIQPDLSAMIGNWLVNLGTNVSSIVYNRAVAVSKRSKLIVTPDVDNTSGSIEAVAFYDGSTSLLKVDSIPIVEEDVPLPTRVAIHPFDEYVFICRDTYSAVYPRIEDQVLADGSVVPSFYQPSVPNGFRLEHVIGEVKTAEWSLSGQYLFIGSSTGVLYVYELVANPADTTDFTLNLVYIEELSDQIVKIALNHNEKLAAISTYNSVTTKYTTTIYNRNGPIFIPRQTVASMGMLLDWSAAGTLLIDSGSKKLLVYNSGTDTFTDRSDLMANVVAGAVLQAVSSHSSTELFEGYVFNAAAVNLASKSGLDLNNLRIKLYNKNVKFKVDLTSIDGYTEYSSNEVYGNGWPQSGKLISNAHYGQNVNGEEALLADNVKQVVLSPKTFKSALIYDATSNKPIAWYEFSKEETVDTYKMVNFNLATVGIASFR